MEKHMADMAELPTEVLQYVVKLRKEAAQYRHQRNEARAELESLKAVADVAPSHE
jgi:hypothetical protein